MEAVQINLQIIAIVLVIFVPMALGLVFLILTMTKTSWHEIQRGVLIGAAVGIVLPILRVLQFREGSFVDVLRILATGFVGAFIGGLIAIALRKFK